jgi:hypothetical protein
MTASSLAYKTEIKEIPSIMTEIWLTIPFEDYVNKIQPQHSEDKKPFKIEEFCAKLPEPHAHGPYLINERFYHHKGKEGEEKPIVFHKLIRLNRKQCAFKHVYQVDTSKVDDTLWSHAQEIIIQHRELLEIHVGRAAYEAEALKAKQERAASRGSSRGAKKGKGRKK